MPLRLPDIELAAIAPELVLSAVALFLLVFDAVVGDRIRRAVHLPIITLAGLAGSLWFTFDQWGSIDNEGPSLQLAGMVVNDGFALFVKFALIAFGILAVMLGRDYLVREKLEEPEYYALLMFSLAGMMLMASSADLIVMFIALETFSIALYVMVGFRRRSLVSQESAMKYFLLGAFSSAFLLLGIALVYGAVGSTNLYGTQGSGTELGIAQYLATTAPTNVGLLVLATGLLIVGLGFKVAAVPFHMWTPDAYQGAPAPVTGFMAAGSKLAGFAALLRLLDVSLFQLRGDWRPIVIGIAVLTMVVGAVFAVVQEDVKRILAYSSIAHAGFVFTGIIATSDDGVAGSLFYLATYGITVVGAFAIVAMVGGPGERGTRLVDYRGLFYRRPALAGALSLFLLSLAGVPLTSGFVGKLVVFGPAIEAGYSWVVVVGAIASAIAAFFYLRIMVVMYMQEPEADAHPIEFGPVSAAVVGLTVAATLALGLAWGPLFDIARQATLFFAL
ncbi:MAG: NADH-quinone oxidoreductase subunit N [Actinomycetota bacterium]